MNSSRGAAWRRSWRAGLAGAAAFALGGAGLLSAQPAQAAEVSVTDAVFEWGVNKESGSGAYYPGSCNFLSAGVAGDAGKAAVWPKDEKLFKPADGNVKILRPAGEGKTQPITWENKCQTADGAKVDTRGTSSDNFVQISGGTGTIDTASDTGTIAWEGSFTIVYYSGFTYWTVSDPKLEVTNGKGRITGTFSGYGADMDDLEKWEKLTPQQGVIADLSNSRVDLTETGFTVTPDYAGVDSGQPDQDQKKDGWGSFPKSWVDFNVKTGQKQYWYTSGGAADPRKSTTPISVTYTASDSQPSPTDTPRPERSTSHEVTAASADAGLTVEVTGEGYENLPNPSTGGEPAGVYAAIVDRAIASDDVDHTTPVAATPVFSLPEGTLSASVTAEAAKLKKDSDYDLLVWVAHGLPKGDALLYRQPIELTAAQKGALFPGTTDPTEKPSEGTEPTDDPSANPQPSENPTEDPQPTGDPSEEAQPAEPALTVEPKTVSLSDFLNADRGAVITASGLEPGNEYEVDVSGGTDVTGVRLAATADEEGVAVYRVHGKSKDHAKRYIGTYTVTMAEPTLSASFSVTADDDGGAGGRGDGKDGTTRGGSSGGTGAGDGRGQSHGSSLPRTGGAEIAGAVIGAGLLVAGGMALVATRRGRR